MYQDAYDYINGQGIIREAKAQGMGIVTVRSLTSGIFQKLMRAEFPALADAELDAFLLNYSLSNPLLDVVLVGMRRVEEVERNIALSDDTGRRLDLDAVHVRFAS